MFSIHHLWKFGFGYLLILLYISSQTKSFSLLLSSVIYIAGYDAAPKSVPPFQMKEILGDYDAIHVRRGDLLKNRKDRFGIERSLHPHLDRDTRPEYIIKRIAQWIPPGRTLFIASNERTPGFFSPLSDRYYLHYFLISLSNQNFWCYLNQHLFSCCILMHCSALLGKCTWKAVLILVIIKDYLKKLNLYFCSLSILPWLNISQQ